MGIIFVVVQSLCHVKFFATPWTAACQASLSFTSSQNLLELMSIELMPSNHLILCCPLLLLPSSFLSIRVFSNELTLCIRWQSIGASASVLPVNIQGWFPLGLIDWRDNTFNFIAIRDFSLKWYFGRRKIFRWLILTCNLNPKHVRVSTLVI